MKSLLHWVLGGVLGAFALGAAAAPPTFADLARHVQYKTVKISPDGTHLAATAVTANGQTVLSLFDLVNRKRVDLTGQNNDDILHFWWLSPDVLLYDVAQRFGGWDEPIPIGELYTVRADGSAPNMLYGYRMKSQQTGTMLKQAVAQKGSAEFLARIEGDPDHILVAITDWNASGNSGVMTEPYRMDTRTGVTQRLGNAPMREANYLADHHGQVRFAYGDDVQGDRVIYQRASNDADWQRLEKAGAERAWPLAFAADDRTVWFACAGQPSGFGACRMDAATGVMKPVWSHPDVEMDGLLQGLAEDSVLGVGFTDGRPSMALIDSGSADAKALLALMQQHPGESVRFVSGTADGSRAIALVEADADPGTFFLYERDGNRFTPLMQRAEWIDPNALGRKIPFTFTTRDGISEQGYVTYPPGREGAKDLPMVVFVHGGPYGIRDRWDYDPYVQALATRGYAVLQVNYRGSGGYGYAFQKAGWREWGGRMQDDVTDATGWAVQQRIADPKRICIYGASYGGYAALEGAVSQPGLYQCAIGYVGVYDLRLMFTRGDMPQNIYGKDYLKRVLGTDLDVLAQRSPVYQLDHLQAKVMLAVGGRDLRVPPVQGESLHAALQKRGIAHEWVYQPNEAHGFYDERNIADLFQKVDAFLDASIGPRAGAGAAAAGAAAD